MIAVVVIRLRTDVPALRTVGSTADLASVVEGRQRHALPAAFVHPVADSAGSNRLSNGVSQRLTHRIGVLLVVPAQSELRAQDAHDVIEPLIVDIRTALVGWQPSAAHEPMTLARGAMVRVAEGTAWWLEELETSVELRAT